MQMNMNTNTSTPTTFHSTAKVSPAMSMSMTTGIGGVNPTVPVSGGGERLRSVWYPKGKANFKKGKANDE